MKKLLPIFALCAAAAFSPLRVQACLSIGSDGQNVNIADESAIIVWDAENQTQHFIRRATFDTKAKDIGFLVPTPNTPQLGDADNNAFYQIDTWMAPKKVYQKRDRYYFTSLIFGGGRYDEESATTATLANATTTTATEMSDDASRVTIIAQQQVGGYEATILAANNIPGLNRWLKNHKYISTPALMKWLQPYVARGWKITAFKISKPDKNDSAVSSRAVRMSFKTARPFFPYREPDQKRQAGSRSLRVYFFAPQRMTGAINGKLWVGRTVWSDKVPSADLPAFAKQLGLSSTRFDGARMTVLEDNSTVRFAPDDVYFQAAFDRGRIVPPPKIEYEDNFIWLPADVLLLVSGGLSALIYAQWKKFAKRDDVAKNV